MAVVNGTMYAVSSEGGLYRVNNPFRDPPAGTPASPFNPPATTTYIGNSSKDLLGIHFSGLATGPASVESGRYGSLLFATDSNGRLYAFTTQGELQPIFVDGATSVSLGLNRQTIQTVQAVAGDRYVDGQTLQVDDSGILVTLEFDDTRFGPAGVVPGNIRVPFDPGNTAVNPAIPATSVTQMAFNIFAALNNGLGNGSTVTLGTGPNNVVDRVIVSGISVRGLAFSNLDRNLFGVTPFKPIAQPGVLQNASPMDVRLGLAPNVNTGVFVDYRQFDAAGVGHEGSDNPFNQGTQSWHFGQGNVVGAGARTYDFAGGAQGTIVSNEFSLKGYSSSDRPSFYFSYWLATEDASSARVIMAPRVSIPCGMPSACSWPTTMASGSCCRRTISIAGRSPTMTNSRTSAHSTSRRHSIAVSGGRCASRWTNTPGGRTCASASISAPPAR